MFSYPSVWLCFLISSSVAIIPDIFIRILENVVNEIRQKIKEAKAMELREKFLNDVPKHFKDQMRKRES